MADDSDLGTLRDYLPGVSDDDLAESAKGRPDARSEAIRDSELTHIVS